MRKAICSVLSLLLIFMVISHVSVLAEGDIETIGNISVFFKTASPADLLYLRDQLNSALLNSDEYESVPVPAGVYQIGIDIPAGKWTLTTSVDSSMAIGTKLEDNGKEIDLWDSDYYASSLQLYFLNAHLYDDNKIITSIQQTVNFVQGGYVAISKGTINFNTYTGQPDFLFYAATLPEITVTKQLDISSYSYHELIKLKNQLNLLIWNSYAWNRVIVPAGLYKIGTDIPAGNWIIESPEEYTRIAYGTKLSERYMSLDISDEWQQEIENKNYRYYKEGEDVSSVDLTVTDGAYLLINENTCASLKPHSGKPASLGFKQFATENSEGDDIETDEELYQLFTLQESGGSDQLTSTTILTDSEIPRIVFNDTDYDLLDYDDVARNPNNNTGKKIYFIGKVIQVVESSYGLGATYRIQLDNSSDIVYVKKSTTSEPRILEDDHVIVCGTCTGVESYQSVLGGTITIPGCKADDISDASKLYERIPLPEESPAPVSQESKRQPDPLAITSITLGSEPEFECINNSDKTIKDMYFRARYYDSDNTILILDTSTNLTYQADELNSSTLGCEIELVPGQTLTLNCESASSFKKADHMELALQCVTFEDDEVYYVPENNLLWFSSKTGDFINLDQPDFTYQYPDQEIFNKAKSFSLGFNYAEIRPEFLQHYQLASAGLLITKISEGGIFASLEIQPGDILVEVDGQSILDEPYFIERGKARLADGEAISITFSRNGDLFTKEIDPSHLK